MENKRRKLTETQEQKPEEGAPIDRVLALLENVTQSGSGYSARCPSHDDHNPSLSISEGDEGQVLINCFAGCTAEEVVHALKLSMKDLFPRAGKGAHTTRNNAATVQQGDPKGPARTTSTVTPTMRTRATSATPGCTLAGCAQLKRLPEEFLKGLGLEDQNYRGQQRVVIPYYDEDGELVAKRYRLALADDGNTQRFRWRKSDKATLYGLWRLDDARDKGFVLLVEGESDCHTLWHHGYPALGVPGASTWKAEWDVLFADIPTIYLVVEPDQGGKTLLKRLTQSSLKDKIKTIRVEDLQNS
jgi:putative DNA primase/helicase